MARSRTPAAKKVRDPDTIAARLGRYAGLVRDWDSFAGAMIADRPTCLVPATHRIKRDALAAMCRAEAMPVTPVTWTPNALRVPAVNRPGRWWPHQAGLYQVQEEASLLPVHMLDPQPGERILDLCAAPGGKSVQIALALGNRGTLVANDKSAQRLTGIRDKMKRLGILNLTTTVHDGADFPAEGGPFDGVLADVPCSGEGTQFAEGAAYVTQSYHFRRRLAGTQAALLRRALRLVKPGGRVVYATCSLAPEENEAILDKILKEYGHALSIRPVALPGLAASPGITEWDGQAFDPEVAKAVRLWPHETGTGGFFAAILERAPGIDPDAATRLDPAPANVGPAPEITEDLATLRDHFGLPDETLAALKFHSRGDEHHATAADHLPQARPRPSASGIPILKQAGRWPKPTTAFAMHLGHAATRHVIDLSRGQRDAYQRRQDFVASSEQIRRCARTGYVIVRYAGLALGAAFLTDLEAGTVRSEFPRIWVPAAYR